MREVLLIKSYVANPARWRDAFATAVDLEVRDWDQPGARDEIDYALVWYPQPGALARLPNLQLIFSLGAGLDHLHGDDIVPPNIPVIRMVEDVLTAGMTEYVLYHVLGFHRHMPQYQADQRKQIWNQRPQIPAWERSVGILGLGVLGGDAAAKLVALGFPVAGWSRTEKQLEGVVSYVGDAQLGAFLARSEILVCLLPLTAQTENIINAGNLARLPKGAFVINAARGGHFVEADLLAAVQSEHIAGAVLDVFRDEPLQPNSPLWRHPRIHITPHIASQTLPESSAKHVIDNIERFRDGRELTHVVDFALGY